MPRKMDNEFDYDDDYDDYAEYEYDYDEDGDVDIVQVDHTVPKSSLWRCSICTYDNDQSLSSCDICGTLRNVSTISCDSTHDKTVLDIPKDFGASVMAKSLFASSVSREKLKSPIIFEELSHEFLQKKGHSFYQTGNVYGHFYDFQQVFMGPECRKCINIGLHIVYDEHLKYIIALKFLPVDCLKLSCKIALLLFPLKLLVPMTHELHISALFRANINRLPYLYCILLLTVPFKFDTPSPDDFVIVGKCSSVKAKSAELASSKVSSSGNKKGARKTAENIDKLKNSSILVSEVSSDIESVTNNKGTTVKAVKVDKADNVSAVTSKSILIIEDEKSSSTDVNNIQASTSGLSNLSLNSNTMKSNLNLTTVSQAQYKPENWMLPGQGEEISKQLSIAIIGHVDSGKSTLSGKLLHLMGRISQKDMHKYEKESKEKGKGSFAYAWALDESASERERGITMTVAVAYFETEKYDVVLLDSPGHKDFVPNMISGAVQADAAILVVDASVGSFEAGMEGNGGGQTKEHTQLIRSFGAEQLIVAVSKMDVVDYSMERFEFVKSELVTFLKSCGFKDSSVSWVPLSAIENQNLVAPASDSRLSSWYQGPHLLYAIDSLQHPVRDIHQPLCIPICDVMKPNSFGQLAVTGKLEGGAVRTGSMVLVMPSGDLATVRSIVRDSNPCSVARAGDSVSVYLQGIDEVRLITGGVLCHPDFPVSIATHLELKILVLDIAVPILAGSQMEFHIHHAKEAAKVLKLSSVIDPKSGKVSKRAPRCLLSKQSAAIEVVLDRPVCASTFSTCRALGRVSLRLLGKTIAVGIVSRIVEQENL